MLHTLDRYLANDLHQVIVFVTPAVFLDPLFVGGKPFQIDHRHIPLSIEITAHPRSKLLLPLRRGFQIVAAFQG